MPYRIIIYLTYLFLFSTTITRSQNIIEAEYFIDIDPGVGNGIPLPISQLGDSVIYDGTLSTDKIETGEHLLIIRIKSDDGLWSLGNYTRFFVEEDYIPKREQSIKKAEVFVDGDQGVGIGNTFNISSDSSFSIIEASLSTSGLPSGPHQLIARIQTSDSTWSLSNYSSFYIEKNYVPSESNESKIKKVEYFIDGPDPGLNQANELLPVTADFSIIVSDTLLMSLDTADLGRHAILARVLTEDDEWSLTGLGEYDYCSPEGVIGGFGVAVENNTFTFSDSSKHAVEYIWDMNNGDSLYEAEPIYTYPEGGTYNVCQTVYSFCDTAITCQSFFLPTPRVKRRIDDLYIPEDSGPLLIEADLNTVFEDLDGDPLTYSVVSSVSEVLATLSNRSLTIESIDDYNGTAQVIIAAEGGGIFAYDTIHVEVFPVNDLPISENEFADVIWDEDSGPRIITRNIRKDITDVEDLKLKFDTYSDTSGLIPTFQTDSLVIYLTENFNGKGTIFIEATDDSSATSIFSFEVSLIPLPDPPIILKEFKDITVFEDSDPVLVTDELSSFFTDPDDNSVSIESIPLGEIVSTQIIEDSLWIFINPDTEGTIPIVINATDGELITSDTFDINILPENDAPRFKNEPLFQVCAEETLEIDMRDIVADSDGFFEDIRFSLAIQEISQSNLISSDLSYSINQEGFLQFTSNSIETAQVSLNIEATDLQNATNDTVMVFDLLGASITQVGDTLFSNEGDSYQWYKGGSPVTGAIQNKFVPTKKDFYQVSVDHGSCLILSEPFQVTGTELGRLFNQIRLYPNPTNQSTFLSVEGEFFGDINYSITDAQGKILFEGNISKQSYSTNHSIDLESFTAGIYILTLEINDFSFSKKIYKY